jgi:hypothetical protein
MRVRGVVIIGPDKDQPGDAQPKHEQFAAEGGLVAGRLVWVGGWWLVAGGWLGGHDSILGQRIKGELLHRKILAIVRHQHQMVSQCRSRDDQVDYPQRLALLRPFVL